MRGLLAIIPSVLTMWMCSSMALAADLAPATVIPSTTDIAALLAKAPTGHPRLFIKTDTFKQIRERAATDPRLATLIAALTHQAETTLSLPPAIRKLEGRRLLGVSREVLGRMLNLSAAWQLTGDPRFAQRGEQELLAVCGFSDWNPKHFLDVGEMTLAVAIGYDWLFPALSETTRAQARTAIVNLGINPSLTAKHWWIDGANNWTQVCHGGLIAGALAIHETIPELAATIVQRGIANLPRVMEVSYAPDGAYPEGPGYWTYGTSYNLIIIESLRSVLGTDFAIPKAQGFLASADYIAHVYGPTKLPFAYSDCGTGKFEFNPLLTWFERETHHPWTFAVGSKPTDPGLSKERFLALALIWAPRETTLEAPKRPLDFCAAGHKPVAMFRSAWDDPKAVYLGVCGGTPSSNHGHMDIGSFVFEANGVRWVHDLGMQEYNGLETKGVDLWNKEQTSQRWTVLRLSNAGHSTLIINDQLQVVKGFGKISNFSTSEPGCSVDLSPIYAGQAQQIERHFSLPERKKLVVTDHIAGLVKAGTVRWQIVTPATVTIAADGHSAQLTKDGQTCALIVTEPANAKLSVSPAAPRQSYDAQNPGISFLAAEATVDAGATVDFHVELVPTLK